MCPIPYDPSVWRPQSRAAHRVAPPPRQREALWVNYGDIRFDFWTSTEQNLDALLDACERDFELEHGPDSDLSALLYGTPNASSCRICSQTLPMSDVPEEQSETSEKENDEQTEPPSRDAC
eukprot:TRINITY_DN84786_c0_g1_i1.p1 TRINITY_DN84786_c0_g1~~TRINITY_DN84786_c0_g1_i1.p1  ORF type:complete len:142 (-),score=16.68 TRINITY_DN84786_c0_g1_i1:27-389(-)